MLKREPITVIKYAVLDLAQCRSPYMGFAIKRQCQFIIQLNHKANSTDLFPAAKFQEFFNVATSLNDQICKKLSPPS